MIKDKNYYIAIYKRQYEEYKKIMLEGGADEDDLDSAEVDYTSEGVLGYYLANYGNEALNEWLYNTEGNLTDEFDLETDRIIKEFFNK